MSSKTTQTARLFDHSVSSVIRRMGYLEWTFEDARNALKGLGVKGIKDCTIRTQLSAGFQERRGAPADLTRKQLQELKKAAKAASN